MGWDTYETLPVDQCESILDRKAMFNHAGVIYMQEPRCQKEKNHEGLHNGGNRIGQWANAWAEAQG